MVLSPALVLKPGREKPVLSRHPWVFSGAIQRLDGSPDDGGVVDVLSYGGDFLARGHFNSRSQIAVRLLSWDPAEEIGRAFWRRRLERAFAGRAALQADPATTAFRLLHAEADGLPGLVVDRYGPFLAAQFLTLGVERCKEELVALLVELLRPRGVYERSDVDVREKEGLAASSGPLWGEEPPDLVEIRERGHLFLADVKRGHKTGFYLDQRENRQAVVGYCAGAELLNAFSYSGAFAVYLAAGGAGRIVNLDSSAEALELARRNMALNGLAGRDDEYVEGDVFQVLRGYRDRGRAFDLVILDPPKFAHSQAQLRSAGRGYKDINLLALKILRPGGILVTFSCSGLVSPELFQKIVFGAALDAGREVQILEKLSQAPDHPVLLSFPESEYLKGLICRAW
jgi:23S rRNA (cytosine1962-C5)-methyltransferase